jgi:hypothetical protein
MRRVWAEVPQDRRIDAAPPANARGEHVRVQSMQLKL